MASRPVQIVITAANRTGRAFAAVRRGFKQTAASLKAQVTGIQGAMASLGLTIGGGILVKFLFDANTEMQKLKANLQTFTGTAEAASAVFDQLAQFAATTPLELADSVQAFITLNAAGIRPTEETLTRLGDLASAAGVSIVDAADAIRAAATGEFERLKQLNITARVDGEKLAVTYQGVTTKINRNVGSITNFLEDLSKNKFAGAMKRQMVTLGGQVSNLKDNLFQLATAVGEGGFSGAVGGALTDINNFISGLRTQQAQVGKWTKAVVLLFKAIGSAVGNLVQIVGRGFDLVADQLVATFFSAKILVFNILGDIAAKGNDIIEALHRIPGVDIDFRFPTETFRQGVLDAEDVMAATSVRMKAQLTNVGQDFVQIGRPWLELFSTLTTEVDDTAEAMGNMAEAGLDAAGKAQEIIDADAAAARAREEAADKQAKADKATRDRIKLLRQAAAVEVDTAKAAKGDPEALAALQTRSEGIQGLIGLEGTLTDQLDNQNLSLERRTTLLQQVAAIRDTLSTAAGFTTPESFTIPDATDQGGGVASIFDSMTEGARTAREQLQGLGSDIDFIAASALVDLQAGWGDAFEEMGAGTISVGKAMVQSTKKTIGTRVRTKGKETLLDAAAAAAKGLTDPLELIKAARLFAVGAGYFTLAGALGGGGGGGGGGAIGGGGGGGAATRRDSNSLSDGGKSQLTIQVQGSFLDLSDPRQADKWEQAMELSKRYGRVVVQGV